MNRTAMTRLVAFLLLLMLLASTAPVTFAQSAPALESCPYAIKPGIPYVWLRRDPESIAFVAQTLFPPRTRLYPAGNSPEWVKWDGVQWWIYASPLPANSGGYGWVELNSLEARCQDVVQPQAWQRGYVVRAKKGVPFLWFRAEPRPGSPPIFTVFPGTVLSIVQGGPADNFNQLWWQVSDPRTGTVGWLEENTLELVSTRPLDNAVPPSEWQAGYVVKIKAGLPFSWLRTSASSVAPSAFTAAPNQTLVLMEGPRSDGTQNWWRVRLPGSPTGGWVEQNSLDFVRPFTLPQER